MEGDDQRPDRRTGGEVGRRLGGVASRTHTGTIRTRPSGGHRPGPPGRRAAGAGQGRVQRDEGAHGRVEGRARRSHRVLEEASRDVSGAEHAARTGGGEGHRDGFPEQVVGRRADEVARMPAARPRSSDAVRGRAPPGSAPSSSSPSRSPPPPRRRAPRPWSPAPRRGRRRSLGDRARQACRQPIATSTTPSRHGRPNVSVTTTPSRASPRRATSSFCKRSALASGPPGAG